MKKVISITVLLTIFVNAITLPYYTLPKTTALCHRIKKRTYHQKIATHFYCITCLTKSIYFLSRLHKQNYHYHPCRAIEEPDHIHLSSATFYHRTIRSYLKKAIDTESLKPIILLLQYTQHNLNTQDTHFLQELLVLIFMVHKQIIFNECAQHHYPIKKSTLETIIAINNIINQLPIAEILNAIDMLVTELPPFIEKYELNSKMTWKSWFKKYWWVPPVFGVWFGLKILLKLQRPYYFYSPYLSPRPQIPLEPISLEPIILEPITDPALLEIRKESSINSK